jgi:hypothetical protein
MRLRILSACALLAACASLLAAGAETRTYARQITLGQPAQPAAKVSDEERKAAEKINLAKDNAAKLAATTEFMTKYPQSTLRPRIGEAFASLVNTTDDPAQRISYAEAYLKLFNTPEEADRVSASLLDAYIIANRAEDSFRLGEAWLSRHPDDVDVMRRLSVVGLNEAIKGNNKFVEQGNKYGTKALEQLEADRRPSTTDAAQWAEYKTKWMPAIYREAGFLAMSVGDRATAKARLIKAAELKNPDPAVYAYLGQMNDEEYAEMAKAYQAMPAGPEKQARLKQVQEQMDKAIEYYARAIAVAGDNPQYENLRKQVRPGLEEYYKFRNNGSTNGLQQLIDKYKQTP